MGRLARWFNRSAQDLGLPDPPANVPLTTIQPYVDGLSASFAAPLPTWGWTTTPWLIERVGTAQRCVQLNSQQIATMPLRYRRSEPAPDGSSYTPAWVSNPDPEFFPNGIGDAVEAAAASFYVVGDAYLYATSRYGTGYPASWTVLDPRAVTVEIDPDGGKAYTSNDVPLESSDVLQITRNPRPGALHGTGALESYAANLAAAFQADSYAADVFNEGGVPNAVLKSSRRLTSEQALDVQTQWAARVQTRGAAPAIIPPELEFEQLAFSPKDLLLLESREFDSKAIAAAFGVPAPLLNMVLSGGMTYTNPAQLFELWWRSELMPAARRIEAALSTWTPRGSWVEFDPSVILRPDLGGMATTWIALLEAEVVTPDEVRAAVLDLPPLSQGEALEMLDEPAGANASEGSAPDVVPPPALEVVEG